ncbi:DUF3187 family protein [Nevskia sp.]|uniref:DUF3187 family protein n=1 Tax=Nevskia sp. TaxID=1929292 RepID=UPI003F70CCE0
MMLRAPLLALACLVPLMAAAEPGFAVRNEATLSRTATLPTLGESRVLDNGQFATRFTVDWSNEYVAQANARESLTVDAETERVTFGFRRGVAEGVELAVDLPLLFTGGGSLDGLIEGWHDAFGLPNGGRDRVRQNRYLVQYTVDGQTRIFDDNGANGIGDIELSAGFRLREDIAFRALAKLPTGRSNRLQGGNAGGALWFDFDPFHGAANWFGYVSAGASYSGQSEVIGAQQKQFVALGGAAIGYRVWRPVSLLVQFNGHSALYRDSDLRALDRPGGQLSFGGRIIIAPKLQLDLAVQEDVLVSSSPDFSIHVGLRYR